MNEKIVCCGLNQSQTHDDVTFPLRTLTIAAAVLKLISCIIFPHDAYHLPCILNTSLQPMIHMFMLDDRIMTIFY